ncbi:hypothetical protein ACU686_45065 [Yinghuangia aomiensis]
MITLTHPKDPRFPTLVIASHHDGPRQGRPHRHPGSASRPDPAEDAPRLTPRQHVRGECSGIPALS